MRAGTSGTENYIGWKLVLLLSTQPCFPKVAKFLSIHRNEVNHYETTMQCCRHT